MQKNIYTKNYILLFVIFPFLLIINIAGAQEIMFQESPENYRLYARDNSDSATVMLQGNYKRNVTLKAVQLNVYKDGNFYASKDCDLKRNQIKGELRIDAGLHQFRFELLVNNGKKDSIIALADSVVCGDAYIITGQSNSHASSIYSQYSSTWCRSFGVKTGYESYSDADKKVRWGRATGNCIGLKKGGGWFMKNKFGVGAWGMELMRLLVEKYKMPVCVINGGSGSSSIEENLMGRPEEASLETSFGRLAYRVDQAGLTNDIKAILWHQGENNSNYQQSEDKPEENYKIYKENFDILLHEWLSVYKGVKKVYLFQLHPGCGGDYQSEMREIQCQIANHYNIVDIMSTTGVIDHQGCHYAFEGYCEFAQRMLPLLGRDFYNDKPVGIITPPKLIKASYTKKNEITLQFDQPIYMEDKLDVKGKIHIMKNQFFFGNERLDCQVDEAIDKGDKIILKMKSDRLFRYVTYLPNKCYINTEDVYEGPWIFGQNKIGALSFDKRKIEIHESICKNLEWNGYALLDSTLNGVNFKVVSPKIANENRDWIWRARFWGHEPQTDLALLKQGFHLVYIDVSGLLGSYKATKIWDGFYDFVTKKYNLNSKAVLEGMSRGGLIIFNWAGENPEKVKCIYGDAPVCDIKSWPLGNGKGTGSISAWKKCLKEYGFTQEQAMSFKGSPIDNAVNIAKAKIPVLNVVGDADTIVPFDENTAVFKKNLIKYGWDLTIIHKPKGGHHPHSLKDPKPIVDFILMNTGNKENKIDFKPEWSMNNITCRSNFRNCEVKFEQNKTGHVAFFGGSITEREGYRPIVCNFLKEKFPSTEFTFTNAGISSTCSNTGVFRMNRDVFSKGPLDLLFVEFAVNDDQDGEFSYAESLQGMESIIRKAREYNPNVNIVITYFVNPEILNDYQHGKIRTSIAAHEAIAKHYGISTCNVAKEVADQISIGTLDWNTYGGTHPANFGNRLGGGMICSLLEKGWGSIKSFKLPEPLDKYNFENGRLVNPSNCEVDKKWSYAIPDWNNIDGSKRERFLNRKMLCATKSGAKLTLTFNGNAIGFYVVAGPDAGMVEVSIDGGDYKKFDLYNHKYSKGLNYPETIMFATSLDKGNHEMKMRISKATSGKGNAVRIMNFVEN